MVSNRVGNRAGSRPALPTKTCTRLTSALAHPPPSHTQVNVDRESGALSSRFGTYWQRPETLESIFYLYRLTGEERYRDWGWEIFQAIERHSRQAVGYAMLEDAMQVPPQPRDMMNSWFLAETLKYLYLLFSPASALDLETHVLTTEAHILRVVPPKGGASGAAG